MERNRDKDPEGRGVSRDIADRVLSAAEDAWTRMGLTGVQIAFGMGLMDIESGFDSTISSPDGVYYGLGQFKASTWETAVKLYNKRYHTKIETSFTSDANTQIAVLGNWIQRTLWPRAQHLSSDPQLNSHHSLEDIAYALHNRGQNEKSTQKIEHYLDHVYKRAEPKGRKEPDDYEWMNEKVLPKARHILGVPPAPAHRQRPPLDIRTPGAPKQVPAGSTQPHSYLEAPWATDPFASISAEAPGTGRPMASGNLLTSPQTLPNDPATWANWLPQYTSGNEPAGMGGPFSVQPVTFAPANAQGYGPSPFPLASQAGNLLAPEADPFREAYERGYASALAEKGRSGLPLQAAKPFYSLKDKIDFLRKVYAQAKPISEETGLSLPFILAHAAHEVDFGKKIEGNNLFNIKADETWRGPTYTKGDKAYRSYPSYEESMKDYLEYLEANPRYGKMFEPVTRASLGRLVDAIHYAGYSDDPLYGHRILAAAKDPIMKQALWQFEKWLPKVAEEG